jgi:hypothetical protein
LQGQVEIGASKQGFAIFPRSNLMMKSIRTFAIAAGSAAMLAAVAAPAPANATHKVGHVVGAFAAGALLGGLLAQPRPVYGAPVYVQPAPVYVQPAPVYVQPTYSPHQAWCLNRYRSYRIQTNTYVTYGGQVRYCVSPYG